MTALGEAPAGRLLSFVLETVLASAAVVVVTAVVVCVRIRAESARTPSRRTP